MEYIDILISLVLALIMFGIGTSLKVDDFRNVFRQPKALWLGLLLQMVFLPLLAFALTALWELPPALQVGIIIISICPGGTTSNFISYLVDADTALSISLTGLNSVIILFSIPTFSNLTLEFYMNESQTVSISFWSTFEQVFLTLLIPALLGVWFNQRMPQRMEKLQGSLKYVNVTLLGVVFAIKFFAGENAGGSGLGSDEFWKLLPPTLILHLSSMLISYFIARRLLRGKLKSTTIGIEVGLQNTVLALLVAGTIIGNTDMTKPALVYATFSFFTTTLFALLASGKMLWALRKLKERLGVS